MLHWKVPVLSERQVCVRQNQKESSRCRTKKSQKAPFRFLQWSTAGFFSTGEYPIISRTPFSLFSPLTRGTVKASGKVRSSLPHLISHELQMWFQLVASSSKVWGPEVDLISSRFLLLPRHPNRSMYCSRAVFSSFSFAWLASVAGC